MSDDHYQQLQKYRANASEDDVRKIGENIHGMNRGPIRKIWEDVQALWAMIKDPQAAWTSKGIAIGALMYLISPLDLIPDVIPVLGLTDDVGVIAAAVASLSFQLTKYRKTYIPPPGIPPPLPAPATVESRLEKLTGLLDKKIISQAEYDAKRQQILSEF